MRYGMVIDLDKCIGCRTCAVICKEHNSQPPGTWWNRVFTPGSEEHQTAVEKDGHLQMYFLPVACQMCENAPCVKVCPVGATYTDDKGRVLVDYERCIGCRYCMTACPYGVRQFNWEDPKKAKDRVGYMKGYSYGYPFDHRDKDDRLVYTQNRPKGVVEKCTFCVQYTDKGELPACVQACPAHARIFGDLDDKDSEISKLVHERQVVQLKEHLGTKPKVYYLAPTKGRR
ncbi:MULTISPECIES: 4Fe-4S dicluster domain-containing protein [Carboxydothermus]|uniref:Molybdopterin oxidoreductase, iron-sulfur binding subunit n=2 Tax=Carboxydothermus TaxID=129957 RepID=Q3AAD4_CARHZ|nr:MULTISPECIES: 4Fe-4S dicluster domain-containing protein [Carboxydothermus]ABB15512.1 molybdopterin oxidoreductase, iron-sulfur binding subunit [Carboxydothermus hydrogenoformans Z-2901]NYE58795.1 molybdopterin-containing oxidoreductase family iron-sulfur binding subunit [Carboxydothermus ferrireducens DSM 11255]